MVKKIISGVFIVILFSNLSGIEKYKEVVNLKITAQDNVPNFKNLLLQLSQSSDNVYFQDHCKSILSVIDMKPQLSTSETDMLNKMYQTFTDNTIEGNGGKMESYTKRQRPFIVSWKSPADGATTLAWLILPENWNPESSYPLYVRLHGYADVYTNPIEYMLYYFYPESIMNVTFENGYTLLPWSRGNNWFEGIGETDVWESISLVESKMKIDGKRKYLVGFSMGGYGTLKLGEKSPETWAALGIFSGALQYNLNLLTPASISKIKDKPTYIVCGTSDGLLSYNQTAYEKLLEAGNTNVYFTTFDGGHTASVENYRNMYEWIKKFSLGNSNSIVDQSLSEMEFFPNPAVSTIHFSKQENNTQLKIFTLDGKIISQFNCVAGENTFDIANLSTGIYLLTINGQKENRVLRLVKQ